MCHPDGYALTCYHVIEAQVLNNNTIKIVYQNVEYEAEICRGYSSKDADIAVVRVLNLPPDVSYLPLDVHKRFDIGDEVYSFGYPQKIDGKDNHFKKAGMFTNLSISGSSIKPENTVYNQISGINVENIGEGYSGSPVKHQKSYKVIGLISNNLKGSKTQALMVPLDGLFNNCAFMKYYHDIFRKINEIAAGKAGNELNKKLQEDKFIPLELERGIVRKKEPGENEKEKEDKVKEWDHSRQWDSFKLSEMFRYSKSYILSSSVGAGKTTFLYWLAGEIIKKNNFIPISLTCRDFEGMKTWEALRRHLISTYNEKYYGCINRSDIECYFDYHYDKGQCVFLFDGLDQIKDNSYSDLVKAILEVSKDNYTIITSRPSSVIGFDTDADKIFLRLKSFSISQQKEYFSENYEKANKLSVYASELISVPMLAYMVKTIIVDSKDKDIFNRTELYKHFINHIIMEHETNKDIAYSKVGKTKNVKEALNHIAFKSLDLKEPEIQKVSIDHHDENLFRISVDELTTFGLVNMIIERMDLPVYFLFFTHQSFQEFLAAQYISKKEERINYVIDKMCAPEWKEVIKFLCGLKGIEIIKKIYSRKENDVHSVLFIAAACLPETKEVDVELQREIIERLKGLIKEAPFIESAMYCLGSIGEIGYIEALLTNADYTVRRSAITVLAAFKDRIKPETIETIVVLLNDWYWQVRHSAIKAIAEFKDVMKPETIETIIVDHLHDETRRVRDAVVDALAKLKDVIKPETMEKIADLLRDKDDGVRLSVVDALAKLKDKIKPETIEKISDLLTDKDLGVRWSVSAVEALVELKEMVKPETVEKIADLLRDEDYGVRWSAVEALAKLKDIVKPETVEKIADLLSDKDFEVRLFAGQALARLKDTVKAETIEKIANLLSDEDYGVRWSAEAALAKLKDRIQPETAERIAALLDNETRHVQDSAFKTLNIYYES